MHELAQYRFAQWKYQFESEVKYAHVQYAQQNLDFAVHEQRLQSTEQQTVRNPDVSE